MMKNIKVILWICLALMVAFMCSGMISRGFTWETLKLVTPGAIALAIGLVGSCILWMGIAFIGKAIGKGLMEGAERSDVNRFLKKNPDYLQNRITADGKQRASLTQTYDLNFNPNPSFDELYNEIFEQPRLKRTAQFEARRKARIQTLRN